MSYSVLCKGCNALYNYDPVCDDLPRGFCSNSCIEKYRHREIERIVGEYGLTMDQWKKIQREILKLPSYGSR